MILPSLEGLKGLFTVLHKTQKPEKPLGWNLAYLLHCLPPLHFFLPFSVFQPQYTNFLIRSTAHSSLSAQNSVLLTLLHANFLSFKSLLKCHLFPSLAWVCSLDSFSCVVSIPALGLGSGLKGRVFITYFILLFRSSPPHTKFYEDSALFIITSTAGCQALHMA